MKPYNFLSLTLATSLAAALPAVAQEATGMGEAATDQTTEQQTTESPTQDAGQAAAEPGTDQTAPAGTAQASPSGEIRPVTITCQDIIDTDIQFVPQLVYWIDGYNVAYNAATGQTDVDPVVTVAENWLAVPVENIVTACGANPGSLAAEVIAQERARNEGADPQ